MGATIGALGLSNKAVYDGDEATQQLGEDGYECGPDMAPNPQPRAVEVPPFEEHLAQASAPAFRLSLPRALCRSIRGSVCGRGPLTH